MRDAQIPEIIVESENTSVFRPYLLVQTKPNCTKPEQQKGFATYDQEKLSPSLRRSLSAKSAKRKK